jgi:3-oxoadipate enol-lactonase
MSTHTAPDRYHERDGARLRWRLEGSGPAIVLLHGWALDLEIWDPVTAVLAPALTVLRFDRCGFGLSDGIPDIHRNVGDLIALMDAAGIDRAALLGMSQGARLAIHSARQHPARVRALLLDGPPALESESELSLSACRRTLESRGIAALRTEILQNPLMQLHAPDPAARRRLHAVVARYCGHDLLKPFEHAPAPELGAITAPTLIMNGALDSPARRAAGLRLQASIPGAQHLILPDAGHLALLDDPQTYARRVLGFCQRSPL